MPDIVLRTSAATPAGPPSLRQGEAATFAGAGLIRLWVGDTEGTPIKIHDTEDPPLLKSGGAMTGTLALAGAPTLPAHAATKAYVDTFLPLVGGTLTGALTLSGAPIADLHAATKAYADTKLPLAGGTLTGALTLSGAPQAGLHAATKTYVDNGDAARLPIAGGTMTGALTLSGAPTAGLHAATKTYVDTTALLKSGGTMTGALTLSGAPTTDLHAATKAYADSGDAARLALTGGALSGGLTINNDSTNALKLNRSGTGVFVGLTLSTTGSNRSLLLYNGTAPSEHLYLIQVRDAANASRTALSINADTGVIVFTSTPTIGASDVLSMAAGDARYANLTGATFTGALGINTDSATGYLLRSAAGLTEGLLYTPATGSPKPTILQTYDAAGTAVQAYRFEAELGLLTTSSVVRRLDGDARYVQLATASTMTAALTVKSATYPQIAVQRVSTTSNLAFLGHDDYRGILMISRQAGATQYTFQGGASGVSDSIDIARDGTVIARINSVGAYSQISDARAKRNVQSFDAAPVLQALGPKRYQIGAEDQWQMGFLAQEVEPHLPQAVVDFGNGEKGLDYSQMTVALWRIVQELATSIEGRLAALERRGTPGAP